MSPPYRINVALQGGGAHGAFTWGALDRLLEDEEIEIVGISGTSAGALNGAALKSGLIEGGRDAARANLDWFWAQVGALNDMRLTTWINTISPAPGIVSRMIEYSLPFSVGEAATRVVSPYAWGPLYRNPLAPIAERLHYDTVCASEGPALYVCATCVRDGKIRVFSGPHINADVLLASACLPTLFQAVELVDPKTGRREAFWDGGYTGNPALFPLFDRSLPDDIVVININPIIREKTPVHPSEIMNRINEISFNTSLLRELRAIQFVKELVADGKIPRGVMKDPLIHMISDDGLMNKLSVATKLVPTPSVMAALKAAGRAAAEAFLTGHKAKIGKTASVDLQAMFS